MIYKLRADVVENSDGNKRIVYGIDVYERVRSVPAAFETEKQVLNFLELCNDGQPCADHFDDMIHDAITKHKTAHP